MMCFVYINYIYFDREKFIFIYSYKRVSKIDVKCSWLKYLKLVLLKFIVIMICI